jgi:uncharacterized protein YaiE (UPF0345 family)
MSPAVESLADVAVTLKANVYFEGRVVSHTLTSEDGVKRTVGVIHPGEYAFNTGAAERMDIIAGACRVKLAGAGDWTLFEAGTTFYVPAKSKFDIAVDAGIAEYLCTFEE